MSQEKLEQLLQELKSGLVMLYGKRLVGVYLYGSYARNDQDAESDLDIMVVLRRFDRYGVELDRASELVSTLSLKFGVSVSMVFLRQQDWLGADTPLVRNVHFEAMPV